MHCLRALMGALPGQAMFAETTGPAVNQQFPTGRWCCGVRVAGAGAGVLEAVCVVSFLWPSLVLGAGVVPAAVLVAVSTLLCYAIVRDFVGCSREGKRGHGRRVRVYVFGC
jgi:hypothetical protein